jgi:protein-tyrosine-phosphatase
MPMSVEQLLVELDRRVQELEQLGRRLARAYGPGQRRESDRMRTNGTERNTLDVVFVCSGNRFRSPLAEATFRQLTEGLPVRVSSLGTLDLGPKPVLPEALDLAGGFGLDLSQHRARPLVNASLEHADLVVGFEQAHVSMAVVEASAPRERTFTMFELVDLLEWIDSPTARDPVARAREAVVQLDEARSLKLPGRAPELADPLGATARVHRDTARRVRDSTQALARALFGIESRPAAEPRTGLTALLRRGLAAN